MIIDSTPTAPVTLNGGPLEFVEDFTYSGSLISKDNGTQKDTEGRLEKACCAFAKLQSISNSISLKKDKTQHNTTVIGILSYCMAQSAGDWLKGSWQRWTNSTIDV